MIRYLLPVLLCVMAFAAGAQSVSDDRADRVAEPTAAAQPASARPQSDRNCLRETGSLITANANARADARRDPGKRACAPASGRAYDRRDIERTGETNLGQALRKLDPAIN